MTGQLSLDLRDAALEQVTKEAFMRRGLEIIAGLRLGRELTGEDIRHAIEVRGVRPHHHNAWGALIMAAVRKELIQKTGRLVKMKDPRSHARQTPIYRA